MLIIADGGSTKTNWCLIDPNGKRSYFNTEGYNPYFVNSDYIIRSLKGSLPVSINTNDKLDIHFYGAGVQNEDKAAVIKLALEKVFPNSNAFVCHDLLAAARALLGFSEGFAAILGTGTNTCLYNGENITKHIDSGAHILGDEGSGFYIGKRLLIDYIRGNMPKSISDDFSATYHLTADEIHESVYSRPLANRYCASFSKFINARYVTADYTREVIRSSFNDFFRNIVSRYPGYKNHKFNCIGSVGFNFKSILEEVAADWGMECGKIVVSPIEDLIDYHLQLQANID